MDTNFSNSNTKEANQDVELPWLIKNLLLDKHGRLYKNYVNGMESDKNEEVLGRYLRSARSANKLTHEDACHETGIAKETIMALENGLVAPDNIKIQWLQLLADAYGEDSTTNMELILGRDEESQNPKEVRPVGTLLQGQFISHMIELIKSVAESKDDVGEHLRERATAILKLGKCLYIDHLFTHAVQLGYAISEDESGKIVITLDSHSGKSVCMVYANKTKERKVTANRRHRNEDNHSLQLFLNHDELTHEPKILQTVDEFPYCSGYD